MIRATAAAAVLLLAHACGSDQESLGAPRGAGGNPNAIQVLRDDIQTCVSNPRVDDIGPEFTGPPTSPPTGRWYGAQTRYDPTEAAALSETLGVVGEQPADYERDPRGRSQAASCQWRGTATRRAAWRALRSTPAACRGESTSAWRRSAWT
jgi:hypothetical protein